MVEELLQNESEEFIDVVVVDNDSIVDNVEMVESVEAF
jgi:hypothetical protein